MGRTFSPKETVRNAEKRIGEKKYSLNKETCEDFVTKCKTGKARSKQRETLESFEPIDILFLPYALPVAIKKHFFDKK